MAFENRLKTNYCVTNGSLFNAVNCFSGSIGTFGDDYYEANSGRFEPDTVPQYTSDFYCKNVWQDWPDNTRIQLLDFDLYDNNDFARLRVVVFGKLVKSYNYCYIDMLITDNLNNTIVANISNKATVTTTSTWKCMNYALCTYGAIGGQMLGIGFVFISTKTLGWNTTYIDKNSFFVDLVKLKNDFSLRDVPYDVIDVSPEYGEASTTGGYTGGTFDDSSDQIDVPTMPTSGVSSAGFVNVYNPSAGQLQQFGSELFPNLSFTPVSSGGTPAGITEALEAIAQIFVDFGNQIPQLIDMYINSNLIQYVIDCHIIPVAPTVSGANNVKVGFKTFSPTPALVTSDYVDFDCGSLNVGEYYANFADYSPYTRAKLYLPFVGFVDIQPEYWQSGTLQVKYRFNVIDGSFVAFVISTSSKSKLTSSVIAQYGGNACVHIPITGLNYANMVSGIVGAMSPLLPSSGGGVGDAMANVANTIANNKPNMQSSNGYNATTSFLTVRTPYLLIERSVSNFSKLYPNEEGIPSNITTSFAGLSGLTKATTIHLDGISGATEDDLNEIAELLTEGVIL